MLRSIYKKNMEKPNQAKSLADERFLVYNDRILKIKEFKEI